MPGEAPRHSKKTWDGQVERRRSLITAGTVLPDDVGDAGRAAPDDVLDAAAAAWSADRVAQGKARSIPDPPQEHEGSPGFAIWY
jgi:predicted RNase H-like nuclease